MNWPANEPALVPVNLRTSCPVEGLMIQLYRDEIGFAPYALDYFVFRTDMSPAEYASLRATANQMLGRLPLSPKD